MQLFLIALGSNEGPSTDWIIRSLDLLSLSPRVQILLASSLYQTSPVGGVAEGDFVNGAALARSSLCPENFLKLMLEIENKLGRKRDIKWGNRTIDLDILLWKPLSDETVDFGSLKIASPTLSLPHPRLLDRDFMLVPAAELAPTWIHPISLKNLATEVADRGFSLKNKITSHDWDLFVAKIKSGNQGLQTKV